MVDRNPEQTRHALLESASREISQHGFQAASLARIINETNVTKGALYHHFPSKKTMGYVIVDETIKTSIHENWIEPVISSNDIIDTLKERVDHCVDSHDKQSISLGCPLINLAQEMSPIDEGFRLRISAIFDDWRNAISKGLQQGQKQGVVRRNISPEASAYFIVAAIEGAVSLAKNSKSVEVLRVSLQGLKEHIESLRNLNNQH